MAKADYSKFVNRAKRLPPPDSDTPAARYRTKVRNKAAKAKKYAAPGTTVSVDLGGTKEPTFQYSTKGTRPARSTRTRKLRGAGPEKTV